MIAVYEIKNTINNKRYVGSSVDVERRIATHKSTLMNDKHKSKPLQCDFNLYGIENFVFNVIKEFDCEEECKDYEYDIIKTEFDNLYNQRIQKEGGDRISNNANRDVIVDNIRKGVNKRYDNMTPDDKRKHGDKIRGEKNGMYGKTHTDEAKNKISKANKGNTYCLGYKASEETKKKLSIIASKRTGDKNPFYGKTHSDEFKQMLSEKFKGRVPTNTRAVIIDGKEYTSVAEAGRQLGVCDATIIHRIKSKNEKFNGYEYK
ncbi:intron-associated endonuclease 1 [Bacillus phage vB_BceH_LY2]|nr:intron-associated endonuclease 1 [Bacillus phage vB_BceH_LY2]